MPTIKGSLNLVTDRPVDSISEVWVRARETRGQGDGLTVGINDRVPVSDGAVEFPALPGPAVLVLVQNGIPVETLPMLVGDEAQQSLRLVVQTVQIADSADRRELEQLSSEVLANVVRAVAARDEAQAAATTASSAARTEVARVVDGAPEDLDTIREVAEYAQANRGITDQLNAAIGNKADKTHTHTWASITGRPDIPVIDVGYRIRWADHAPSLYPAGVSVSMSATEQGWGTALAVGNPDYVDDGFVVILTIRNGRYAQSAIQMVFSYTNVARPVYIRKYNGEADGWSNFRKLTNDGHKHDVTDINGAASKNYVDSRPALFSGAGAPPTSIAGAVAGDWWLNTSTLELHKITGVEPTITSEIIGKLVS